ncbi:uncharacterized protein [Amphiura filiformis]|uniref:uncharacterized protein n=1 Tax=Amphiura filiformis TaxID=82378 RepID=UPI003B219B93
MALHQITYVNREDLDFVDQIGEGGFSTVWKVKWNRKERQEPSDNLVHCSRQSIKAAAKILNKINTPELQFLAKLAHPHVVKLLGVVDKVPDFMLILELCERGSLDSYLENLSDEEVHPCLLYCWGDQGARAIEYLHKIQVIHRDIKSANFLITLNLNIKLCDFGLAKDADATVTTKIKGTWGWTAPEIFQESHLSPSSDIFAFGTVLWELLTRKIPFKGVRYQEVKKRVCNGERMPIPQECPQELRALIEACWNGDRRNRPDITSVLQVICKVRDRSFEMCKVNHSMKKDVPFTKLYITTSHDDSGSQGHQVSLDVCYGAPLATIKSRLLGSSGAMNHEYQLYHGHRRLDDNMTLLDYNICDGECLLIKPSENYTAVSGNESTNEDVLLRLAAACTAGNIVEILNCLHQEANVNFALRDGDTPLHKAALDGNKEACEVLLKADADVHDKNKNERTPLHNAAWNGHKEACEVLLKAGADVHDKDKNENTPLHNAAFNGHQEACELLLKAGADVHDKDENENTPLHNAAFNGHQEACELLLKAGADVHDKDKNENTALHKAAFNGHQEACEVLLKAGADVHDKDKNESTTLHKAAFNGHQEACEVLLKAGADDERTPLHKAAFNGHQEACEVLLKAGADVHDKDKNERTPLHNAAWNGHKEACEVLLKAGADVHDKDKNENTPLHNAAFNGHQEACELLLKAGADVHDKDKNESTTLHKAAFNGHQEACEVLLKAGADVHDKDENENTALHKAAFNGHQEACEVLLKAGADVHDKDMDGDTPLHKAALDGHKEACEVLLKADADVHDKNKNEWTPLHKAAWNGHKEACEVLLKAGADVHNKDENEMTPLHKAAYNGHQEACEMLLKAGADEHDKDKACISHITLNAIC